MSLDLSYSFALTAHRGAPSAEKRRQPRRPASRRTLCRVLVTLEGAVRPATVRNISASGVLVVLGRFLPPGTGLTLELQNPLLGFRCRRDAQVVRTRSGSDGGCLLGLQFSDELTDDELEALT